MSDLWAKARNWVMVALALGWVATGAGWWIYHRSIDREARAWGQAWDSLRADLADADRRAVEWSNRASRARVVVVTNLVVLDAKIKAVEIAETNLVHGDWRVLALRYRSNFH